jgi:hypothetical protein
MTSAGTRGASFCSAQDTGNLGRQEIGVEAEHLPRLHRPALHPAQRLDDAHRIPDEGLAATRLASRLRLYERQQPRRRERHANASHEAGQSQEPLDG